MCDDSDEITNDDVLIDTIESFDKLDSENEVDLDFENSYNDCFKKHRDRTGAGACRNVKSLNSTYLDEHELDFIMLRKN